MYIYSETPNTLPFGGKQNGMVFRGNGIRGGGGGGYYLKYTFPELTEHFNNRLKYPIHATIYVLLTGLKCFNNFHDKTVINPNESESVKGLDVKSFPHSVNLPVK